VPYDILSDNRFKVLGLLHYVVHYAVRMELDKLTIMKNYRTDHIIHYN